MTDALSDRLDDVPDARVVAFPDGSVDTYYRVRAGAGGYLDSRERFGAAVGDGSATSFSLDRQDRESGGQAVNMAKQAHALDARVSLFGHLDDPAFDDLPFDAASMGDPADVSVLSFEDESVVLAERPSETSDWSLADLRATAGGLDAVLDADAVCCGNWVSFPGLTDALAELGSLDADGVFVLDPGDLTNADGDALAALWDALADLEAAFDVVVSVDPDEASALSAAFDAADGADGLADLRARADLSGVVSHGEEQAVAATRDGVRTVESYRVRSAERTTGAGDRFSAGLAVGLGVGWEWEVSLALANACASYFVGNVETGDRESLREFVAARR
ncbi:hypothetical protein DMJ13_06135 [halophilic archaeon]|nr:hypothetical protein DMJ13_06135 [halophilic archaeon]